MGQIDRVDEVRRRATRTLIAEPEADRVGPNPVVVYAADGVTVLRIISSEALAKRDRGTGQESPQTSPRAYHPTALRAKGSTKLLGTRSWA